MPFFAYGWPKLFNSDYGASNDDSFLHLAAEGQFMFAVSSSAIQVWSSGLHRVRLSEIIRTEAELRVEGNSIDAFWSTQKSMLAVLTAGDYLLLYSVHTTKDQLLSGSAFGSIPRTELYLRSKVLLELGARATCLTGDSRHLLVGTDEGSLGSISWQGKLREITFPVPLDPEAAEIVAGTAGLMAAATASTVGFQSAPIVQLDYCELTRMLAVVLADGSCALCSAAHGMLAASEDFAFARWVCLPSRHAKCARIGAQAQMMAVGCANGEVVLYRLHRSASTQLSDMSTPQSLDMPLRVLTLEPWGHTVLETGGVTQVAWSPDCRAVAVSFIQPGLVVWSPSGCRLMCSLRQVPGSLARKSSMGGGAGDRANCDELGAPLEQGLSAMAWGPHGYQLLLTEISNTSQIVELQFARTLSNHHRVAHAGTSVVVPGQPVGEEVHVLQAHDRLLIISETLAMSCGSEEESMLEPAGRGSDLVANHVLLPYQYISSNWPLTHASVTDTGMDIAVAGTRGVALYSRASEKWRLFGDISQERQIRCRALCWLEGIIMVCSGGVEPALASSSWATDISLANSYELLLFPKYHLDFSSLLCRHTLPQPPLAFDSVGNYILVASEPLEITLLEVVVVGQLTPSGNPRAHLQPLREISMLDIGRPLLNLALVPPPMPAMDSINNSYPEGPGLVPRQVVLLRWGGLMSALDLEKGSEVALSTEVESFWLGDSLSRQSNPAPHTGPYNSTTTSARHSSNGMAADAGRQGFTDSSLEASTSGDNSSDDIMEMPWWAYGPAGMQLLFPSSVGLPQASLPGDDDPDVELEFDQEVYPVGISLADASIVGITQRIVRGLGLSAMIPGLSYHQSGTGQFPGFYPIPESQPVLPCLLRRLLQKNAFSEAIALARRHERGPHFTRSLEWLLFTTLEMETSKPNPKISTSARWQTDVSRAGGDQATTSSKPTGASPLLIAAADLARQFPQFADVVVSVARKTDAQLWPPLFAAVGSPSALLEGLMDAGALTSAACFLLVIDRLEGASVSHAQALRLIRFSMQRGQYGLCGELLRFIIPSCEADNILTSESQQDLPIASTVGKATDSFAAPAVKWPEAQSAQHQQHQHQQDLPPVRSAAPAPAVQEQSWMSWLVGFPSAPAAAPKAPLAGSALATVRNQSQSKDQELTHPQSAAAAPLSPTHGKAAAPSSSTAPHHAPAEGVTPAYDARNLVAQHAWSLAEDGHLAALASLAVAVSSLEEGLVVLMQQHRNLSAFGMLDHSQPTAQQLMAATATAVQELPVWTSGDVEHEASYVLTLCSELGLIAYTVALAVLLVNSEHISPFRRHAEATWVEFVALMKADPVGFGFLFDIIDALSGDDRESDGGAVRGVTLAATGGPGSVAPVANGGVPPTLLMEGMLQQGGGGDGGRS